MFQTLIDNAAQAAKAVAPQLGAMAAEIGAFAGNAGETAERLKPLIDEWSAGRDDLRPVILATLSDLTRRLADAMAADQAAYAALSRYRDEILSDQREVAQIARDVAARIEGLRARLDDARNEAETQRKRLTILRAIPIPLPWVIGEIANLIRSGQTMEQELSSLQAQQGELQGLAAATAGGAAAVQGFAGHLGILETATQNLVTYASAAQGNMMQMMQALTSGAGSTVPVVVQAYVATLAAEARSIQHYLMDA